MLYGTNMSLPVEKIQIITDYSVRRVIVKFSDVELQMSSDQALYIAYALMRAVGALELNK